MVEGENATFNCTPVLQIAVPILNTIAPGADVGDSETLLSNPRALFVDVDTDDDGTNDARIYNWLNVERVDHGRQFFCTLSDDESNYLTLNVNCECYDLLVCVGYGCVVSAIYAIYKATLC